MAEDAPPEETEEQEETSTPVRDPELAAELVDEGLEAAEAGDWREAHEALDQACELDPESVDAHYNLGVLLGKLANEDIEHEGLFENKADEEIVMDKAIAAYEEALDLDPDHVPSLNNIASHHAVRGNDELAIEALERSLAIDPDQPEVQMELEALLP